MSKSESLSRQYAIGLKFFALEFISVLSIYLHVHTSTSCVLGLCESMWVCRRTSVCLCVCLYLWCGAFSTTTTTEEWRKECALKVHTNDYANTMNNAIRLPLRHAEIKWLAGVSKQQRMKFLSAKSRLALWCDARTRYQIGFACDDRIFAVWFAAQKSSQFTEIAHEEFVFFSFEANREVFIGPKFEIFLCTMPMFYRCISAWEKWCWIFVLMKFPLFEKLAIECKDRYSPTIARWFTNAAACRDNNKSAKKKGVFLLSGAKELALAQHSTALHTAQHERHLLFKCTNTLSRTYNSYNMHMFTFW